MTVVTLKKEHLDAMLMAAAAAVPEPKWEPNENLGEGLPFDAELRYRQAVLDRWEVTWNDVQKQVLASSKPAEERIRALNMLIQHHITDMQQLALEQVTECWQAGVEKATQQLEKFNITPNEDEIKLPPQLVNIVAQQQDNMEDHALLFRGKIRQKIRMDEVKGFYATR